jgi:hypothetical protein
MADSDKTGDAEGIPHAKSEAFTASQEGGAGVAPPQPPSAGAGVDTLRLRDIPEARDQTQAYLDKNRAIEASGPFDDVWGEITRKRDLNEVFATTVKSGLLTLNQALRFMLYMKTDVEPMVTAHVRDAARRPRPFLADAALALIEAFYDEGVKVLAGPEEDSDDEDSEGSEDSDGELSHVSEGEED